MYNPIGFRSRQVTFWTTVIYVTLITPLVIFNEIDVPAPDEAPFEGVNLTEAWLDLATLTQQYHPYNSHRNDDIRNWLLVRIEEILDVNGASWTTEVLGPGAGAKPPSSREDVVVFDDMMANCSFAGASSGYKTSCGAQANYFEGNNIYVYIRGSEDDDADWWDGRNHGVTRHGQGGTMVNAHFDSVPSAYGATDNGLGTASVLQLIKHFSLPQHRPRRGIVALLNNGEELGLNGAVVFGQSPMLPFVHTFVNLDGAGAGGRAILFRSTDLEVTRAYAKTSEPFGLVLASDAFQTKQIASRTDYTIWTNNFGQRGLDLAFYRPRALYHTPEDDARHASRSSLWHMLSATIHATTYLSGDSGNAFVGPRPDGARNKVANGSPTNGVWFDLFGQAFVLFNLRVMFAWSLIVLVAGPLILLLVTFLVHKVDKYYLFSSKVKTCDAPGAELVSVGGWKGLLRFPVALGLAGALQLGAAFLIRRTNPFVIHRSKYSVWAMMFSLFYLSFWCIMRGAAAIRPSALHRAYAHAWLFTLGWVLLVASAILEDRFHVGGVYPLVVFESAVFLSMLVSLLEMYGLPKKASWAWQVGEGREGRPLHRAEQSVPPSPGDVLSPHAPRDGEAEDEEAERPTETTPLVGGDNTSGNKARATFATTYRQSISALVYAGPKATPTGKEPLGHEQAWSIRMPSWVWWFQFLILGPFTIILATQTGLVLVDTVMQTGVDGSDLLVPYLLTSFFTIFALLPLTPFIHRISHHIPLLLLAVFAGTLVWNLAAFPFGATSPYKAFFQQEINLDTGASTVHIHGVEKYVRLILANIPSVSGQQVSCAPSTRPNLEDCAWNGAAVRPRLNPNLPKGLTPEEGWADLVTIKARRADAGEKTVRLEIDALDSKSCYLDLQKPAIAFEVVNGSGWDDRFGSFPDGGVGLIKLWRRSWSGKWVVDVRWTDDVFHGHVDVGADGDALFATGGRRLGGELKAHREEKPRGAAKGRHGKEALSGLGGSVVCLWSDANVPGTIPAWDEAVKYGPTWSVFSKFGDGMVEGRKAFQV